VRARENFSIATHVRARTIEMERISLRRYLYRQLLLQCVAVCCSVLQCVAVCCSVLQCVASRANSIFYDGTCIVSCSYTHTHDTYTHTHTYRQTDRHTHMQTYMCEHTRARAHTHSLPSFLTCRNLIYKNKKIKQQKHTHTLFRQRSACVLFDPFCHEEYVCFCSFGFYKSSS